MNFLGPKYDQNDRFFKHHVYFFTSFIRGLHTFWSISVSNFMTHIKDKLKCFGQILSKMSCWQIVVSAGCRLYKFSRFSASGLSLSGLSIDCYRVGGLSDNHLLKCMLICQNKRDEVLTKLFSTLLDKNI